MLVNHLSKLGEPIQTVRSQEGSSLVLHRADRVRGKDNLTSLNFKLITGGFRREKELIFSKRMC